MALPPFPSLALDLGTMTSKRPVPFLEVLERVRSTMRTMALAMVVLPKPSTTCSFFRWFGETGSFATRRSTSLKKLTTWRKWSVSRIS